MHFGIIDCGRIVIAVLTLLIVSTAVTNPTTATYPRVPLLLLFSLPPLHTSMCASSICTPPCASTCKSLLPQSGQLDLAELSEVLKAVDIREEDIPSILTAVTNRKGRKEETPRSKDNPFQSESKDGKGGKSESVGGGGGDGSEGTEGVLFDFDDLKTMISQQTIYQVRPR